MNERQHSAPILLNDSKSKGRRLMQVPIGRPVFREEKLQHLLAEHPEVIPVSEIEPAFNPLVFLGREVPCGAGSIDLLYTNPSGYLTIVETKLWDNPESRRAAVAQIIDYATSMSSWGFDDLKIAVSNALSCNGNIVHGDLLEMVSSFDPNYDEPAFIDNVSRNLSRGSFLLLIAGNGIREEVEKIGEYLQKTPGLHFSLALVEFNLYRVDADQDYPLYIQPRTIAKTVELVRAVVDVKAPPELLVSVTIPSKKEDETGKTRRKLTEEIFFAELAANCTPGVAEQARLFIQDLKDLGLVSAWRSSSVSMRFPEPGGSGYSFTVIVLTITGDAYVGWLDRISDPDYGGYDADIANKYSDVVRKIADLPPGVYKEGDTFPLSKLFDNKEIYFKQVKAFTGDIIKAARLKTENE